MTTEENAPKTMTFTTGELVDIAIALRLADRMNPLAEQYETLRSRVVDAAVGLDDDPGNAPSVVDLARFEDGEVTGPFFPNRDGRYVSWRVDGNAIGVWVSPGRFQVIVVDEASGGRVAQLHHAFDRETAVAEMKAADADEQAVWATPHIPNVD